MTIMKTLAAFLLSAGAVLCAPAQATSYLPYHSYDGGYHDGGCGGGSPDVPCGQTLTKVFYDSEYEYMSTGEVERFGISYNLLDGDWQLTTATLWVKAMDDARNLSDTGGYKSDGSEVAQIISIEGKSIENLTAQIDGLDWYFGYDVLSFMSAPYTSPLSGKLQAAIGDFWFKEAKLVLGYNSDPCPTPTPVPLPAAGWLFGSALIGFMAMSNRRKV